MRRDEKRDEKGREEKRREEKRREEKRREETLDYTKQTSEFSELENQTYLITPF
jgi:hypothetical protein